MIHDKDMHVHKKGIRANIAPIYVKLLTFCGHYEGRKINLVKNLFFQTILQMNEIIIPQVNKILLAQSKKNYNKSLSSNAFKLHTNIFFKVSLYTCSKINYTCTMLA